MCVPTSPPPGLFLESPAQGPQDWLIVSVAVLVLAVMFLLFLPRVPVGYLRRQAIGVLAISFVLIVSGVAFTFLSELPWERSVDTWYEQQSDLLLVRGCSLVGLDTAHTQAMALGTRVDLVGQTAMLGGFVLLFVWGIQYTRGKL